MRKAKTVQEKITLIILFFLALPFSLAIFLIFVIIYSLIFPFEYPFYKKSNYKKELKAKYSLFITKTKFYKIFNQVISLGNKLTITINDEVINYYVVDDIAYVINYNSEIEIPNKKVTKLIDSSFVTNEFYLENKENDEYLFY